MPNSLTSPPVGPLLDRLFLAADADDTRWPSVLQRYPDVGGAVSARDKADAFAELHMPRVTADLNKPSAPARPSRHTPAAKPNLWLLQPDGSTR